MATNYENIFRIDPSKNALDHFAGDSNTLAYFLTDRQGNKGLPPLITGISGNYLVIRDSSNNISYFNIKDWNVSNIPYILLPGIVGDGAQRIGEGQATSMRLYDSTKNEIIDLSINRLKDEIKLYIDTNGNEIYIKTLTDTYKDTYLWSIIFNVLDVNNGMPLIRGNDIDISLNTNYSYTDFSNLNLPYFNINTISDVSNNLLKLSNNRESIGTLILKS